MRVASPEFGPVLLIWIRVGLATFLLSPFLLQARVRQEVFKYPFRMAVAALFNSVIPWTLLAYAVLSLEAGFTSLLNAATPMFAAIIGFLWKRIPLSILQVLGLAIGFMGVAILASNQFSFKQGGSGIAILAAIGAALCYGFASQYIKSTLSDLSSKSITLGNLACSTLILTPFIFFDFPEQWPSTRATLCAIALAVLSTAVAFLLLFELLSRTGATAIATVTYIIPVFGILFGSLFLGEVITRRMLIGMLVAFVGAALVTQLIVFRKVRA